jgi:ATP-binding cassette subfamily B protein
MKLLPATQLVIFNWATIKSNSPQISDALDLIEGEIPQKDLSSEAHDIEFKKEIELKDVWFRYGDGEPWILEGINLRIPRGTKLGVIGQTGAGKSTLIDLLLGLLQPTKGTVAIDGVELCKDQRKSWGRRVAHVPQSIYLIDTSVAENIAFGKPKDEIVSERVVAAAQKARIHDFVNDGASGFKTLVGERGVRISGGQRQRIGIARALYKKADVIVLDEATSSLDMKTEDVIIQTILDLGRDTTLIMIAHRLTTLEKCDRIVELESGRVARECHYDEL